MFHCLIKDKCAGNALISRPHPVCPLTACPTLFLQQYNASRGGVTVRPPWTKNPCMMTNCMLHFILSVDFKSVKSVSRVMKPSNFARANKPY